MPRVLYIAGWLRSGTTIAGNVLGSARGAVHIGELHYLWMKEHPAGFECGCGESLFACPFWQPVIDRLGLDAERRLEIRALRRGSWRNKNTVARYRDWRRGRPPATAYPALLGELYAALADSSGATLVVDSTKNPSDALAVAQAPGVELYVLHVVRDPRATAYSGMQEKVHGSDASGLALKKFSANRTTLHWDTRNLLIERCVRPALADDRYRRVRYEDLMASPRESFEAIAEWVGLKPDALPFTGESTVRMERSHTVMGNPSRHSQGEVELRLDTRWVDHLGARDGLSTTALAAPLMARYGYPRRRAAAASPRR